MQKLTDQEMKEVTGGRVYRVICYGNSRVSTGVRNCTWEYGCGVKTLTEFMHGRHITKTGHIYAKFNW